MQPLSSQTPCCLIALPLCHPGCAARRIQFGGGGIFGACKNIDISEINGYVTVRGNREGWRRAQAQGKQASCAAAVACCLPCPCCRGLCTRFSWLRLLCFAAHHTCRLCRSAALQVRGDVGEVAPDGRVLRPARLTVQLEAPGAHRWTGTARVWDWCRQPGCLGCGALSDLPVAPCTGLAHWPVETTPSCRSCAATSTRHAGSRRGRRRPMGQPASRPSPASPPSSARAAACGAAATARQ